MGANRSRLSQKKTATGTETFVAGEKTVIWINKNRRPPAPLKRKGERKMLEALDGILFLKIMARQGQTL